MYDLSNRTILQNDVYTPWTRPEDWPDLDSLNLEMSGTESFVYMTYRTGHPDDAISCGWTLVSGQSITFDAGYIEDGQFISTVSAPMTFTTNSTFSTLLSADIGFDEGYIVFKVTGRFSKFYFIDGTRPSEMGNGTIKYYMQPVLERIWYVPELTHFYNGNSSSTTGSGAVTLQRDKIVNGNGNNLTSLYCAWTWCFDLQSLDISGLHTQNVTNMSQAFQYCKKLEYLDVSHFNTAKVTSFGSMFSTCHRLKTLDLHNWEVSKVTGQGMTYMFYNCFALKQILGLENFQTGNITHLTSIFCGCQSLTDLSSIANWNISKVTTIASAFYQCGNIETLDLSHWDVSKVTNIGNLFYYCTNLKHILFPQVQTSTLSGSMAAVFFNCMNLQEIDLTWIKPITNAVTTIGNMFGHCRSVIEINIPEGWDITGCTASESCYRIFADCYKLQRITGISNWNMSGYNYSLAYSFENDFCLQEIDISNWRAHPTTMYYAFLNCRTLEEIDLTGWSWENMTGTALSATFQSCHSLKTIKGIEHMGDSGNITQMGSLFLDCFSLISLPNINSWNLAKVTTCSNMFSGCYSLQSLTISNWSLPKCTSISYMFRYCYNMKELELQGWSIPLVTDAGYIFNQMYSLTKFSGLPIAVNFRAQELYSLPEDQWVRVFTQLPSVSSKTINMTTAVLGKLTDTTKAIATDKGWTLSN